MATIVLGLDGANWALVDPWLEAGHLPTLEHLRSKGLWGVSESVLPPVTCPNWKCYSTSRSPDHHNIYWWEKVDKHTTTIDVPDSTSFTAPEFWDYLMDEDVFPGVMNLPMSYPPRGIDGVIIAGGPRSRESGYTHPTELEARLEVSGYRVHPESVVTSNEDDIEPTLELIEKRFETARWLLDEYELDFLHLTIFHLNVLQHFFWNDDPVRRAWDLIDREIGKFVDDGHTIFLMSDHGCGEIETVFHINDWLSENGYLTTKTTIADYLLKTGLTQERLASIVRKFGLESRVRRLIPRRVIERFPDEEGIKRDNKFDKMVAEESVAIASGQGLIYVLSDPESDTYERTIESLIAQLSRLETPAGRPVCSAVHRGDELYPSGNPRFRPDVVFEQGPGIHTTGAIGKGSVFGQPGRWRAENIRDGIFLAYGEGIDPLGEIDPISILDIAPTVLHYMGVSIPTDFEGTPVESVTKNRGQIEYREPLPRLDEKTTEGSNEVRNRLADLGYLE